MNSANDDGSDDTIMRISEFAAQIGVAAGTLRDWDKNGKLPAERTADGIRIYRPSQLERARELQARRPWPRSSMKAPR